MIDYRIADVMVAVLAIFYILSAFGAILKLDTIMTIGSIGMTTVIVVILLYIWHDDRKTLKAFDKILNDDKRGDSHEG